MKPVVRYKALAVCKVGDEALVFPLDHPGNRVSNAKVARTSRVVRYDRRSGEFETENTRYVPTEDARHPGLRS